MEVNISFVRFRTIQTSKLLSFLTCITRRPLLTSPLIVHLTISTSQNRVALALLIRDGIHRGLLLFGDLLGKKASFALIYAQAVAVVFVHVPRLT